MMSILEKLLALSAGLAGPFFRGVMPGNVARKRVLTSPVKFSTAPSECSEDEHQRRNQAAIDKRERKAAKLRARP